MAITINRVVETEIEAMAIATVIATAIQIPTIPTPSLLATVKGNQRIHVVSLATRTMIGKIVNSIQKVLTIGVRFGLPKTMIKMENL